mmetsp:Transcript_11523/g.17370  ORF Transcript_11523/g.17370 Transcript_11523/m.17370 type:complete len:172 (+) Transcript_11523:29-544(+)
MNHINGLMNLGIAAAVGAFIGIATSACVVSAFAAMILNSFFNIYYATIFFLVGSYHTYKIVKKSRIEHVLESTDPGFEQQDNSRDDEAASLMGRKEVFKRPVLLTEKQVVYRESGFLSFNANNKANKLNFGLEIVLTLCVFLSAFLVLTIEKDWWGGYLSPKEDPVMFTSF